MSQVGRLADQTGKEGSSPCDRDGAPSRVKLPQRYASLFIRLRAKKKEKKVTSRFSFLGSCEIVNVSTESLETLHSTVR